VSKWREARENERAAQAPKLVRALELARAIEAGADREGEARELARLVVEFVQLCRDCGAATFNTCPCCGVPFCAAAACPGQDVDCCSRSTTETAELTS
jgi:hypothetical protein